MTKFILILVSLISALATVSNAANYSGSTLAAVTLSGGIVSAQHINIDKKYKRKDCPVCKGKGWYISGDDITKVPCGYCEEELELIHPPIILKSPTRVFKK